MLNLLRLALLGCSFCYLFLFLNGDMAHPSSMALVLTFKIGSKFSWADPQTFLRSPWRLCPLELGAEDSSVAAPKLERNTAAFVADFPYRQSE
jgi:hypothetical protein